MQRVSLRCRKIPPKLVMRVPWLVGYTEQKRDRLGGLTLNRSTIGPGRVKTEKQFKSSQKLLRKRVCFSCRGMPLLFTCCSSSHDTPSPSSSPSLGCHLNNSGLSQRGPRSWVDRPFEKWHTLNRIFAQNVRRKLPLLDL